MSAWHMVASWCLTENICLDLYQFAGAKSFAPLTAGEVMSGATQERWQHSLPRRKALKAWGLASTGRAGTLLLGGFLG